MADALHRAAEKLHIGKGTPAAAGTGKTGMCRLDTFVQDVLF
jgi:hypothetical protein